MCTNDEQIIFLQKIFARKGLFCIRIIYKYKGTIAFCFFCL